VDRAAPSRFTTVPPLVSMEGRVQDAIVRPDGAIVTAGAVDRALATLEGVAVYQTNQRTPEAVEIDVVEESPAPSSLLEDVKARLAPLLEGLTITARKVTAIAAEPSGKYRLSRRHFPLDLGKTFDGCQGVSL